MTTKREMGVMLLQMPKTVSNNQKLRKCKDGSSILFTESMALTTP